MKILVVDDDKNIVSMISDFLKIHNMIPLPAYSGHDALTVLNNNHVDLIILDVNLGDCNGFNLCKSIRENSHLPIIFLTAKITQSDKILGLGIGADDYLTKPFDPLELIARVKSLLRRTQNYSHRESSNTSICTLKHIRVDKNIRAVSVNNTPIELSTTEFHLLTYLMENRNRILTRHELLLNVWNSDLYTENTVNTYIMRLRDKIELDKNYPEILITIRGEGYLMKE